MKRFCVILAVVAILAGWTSAATAEEWWRGDPGRAPDSVEGVPVGSSSFDRPSRAERESGSRDADRPVVYEPTRQQKKEARQRMERAAAVQRNLQKQIVRLGASPTVGAPDSSVVVRPGTSFFGLPAGPGAALAAPLSGVRTPGTRIAMEALARAAAILQHGLDGQSDEDVAFCAGEAAQAMEGADLRVVVVDARSVVTDERTREFGRLVESLQEKRAAVEVAKAQRLELEATMNGIARELKVEGADRPLLETRLFAEYAHYREVAETEQKAKADVEELVGDLVSWGDNSPEAGDASPTDTEPNAQE